MRSICFGICFCALRAQSVVVTGSAQPLPLEEADRSVSALDKLPEKSPLFGGFYQRLQLDSSIDLRQRGNGVQGDISIRGGTFGQNLPNPNLKPEEAMTYEAGADWHLRSHWRAFATVFNRDEKIG